MGLDAERMLEYLSIAKVGGNTPEETHDLYQFLR